MPSGVSKRRLRSISRSRIEVNARRFARPVSSSVTAWRSTVSWRLAFSIETTAWPARYSSSSSSSRVNGAPAARDRDRPRGTPAASTSERSPIASAWAPPALRRHGAPRALRRPRRPRARRAARGRCPARTHEDVALCGADHPLELARDRAHLVVRERPVRERQRAPRLRLAGVDGLAHGERHHAVAVETGGEGVAHAPDRLLELLALALDLLDLRPRAAPTCR